MRSTPVDLLQGQMPIVPGRKRNRRNCCQHRCALPCLSMGVALCTDLYAYHGRFWSDLSDPFRRRNRGDLPLICDVNQASLGTIRLMVAVYTSLFGFIAVLSNAGWLVLRVRRSLEEVFNFFVSFYFIFKALKILFQVRNLFGYFNVPIGLFCAVLVNRFLFAELNAYTVQMPLTESLGVSHLIAPPITVAKSERRLRKPCLFSLDLFVAACIMPLVSGLLGWPFLSPATVRSNTHVIALTKWNTKTPPGVPHRIIGCVEQRVTGFTIGLLVALSVTLEARLFALVPMGALYGMFLYMGIMGLRDLVLIRRLCVLLKRRKHWKDREYLRHLPPSVMAVFVTTQFMFIGWLLAMNWVTEFARVGATSLVFPFILLIYAITRECLLPRFTLLRPHLEQVSLNANANR
ncbi:unnamed protein product [Echinostoma caproni]|uniref:HCO3_cotransp domain-containing protein n=1 Tax=Echinostoma caproni TaxID=27848 RepID=A0A183AR33_9TREM|nr:unnamed protein product [Echinostoma caproni]